MTQNTTQAAPDGALAPPKSRARTWIVLTLLALYTGLVLYVTLTPTPDDLGTDGIATRLLRVLHRVGVPTWFDFPELEFTANIAMFVPLGFLLGLALPRRALWLGVLILPAFSAAIEWTQGSFLVERVSDLRDIVANTAGGWIGLAIAAVIRGIIARRDRRVIDRALWERDRAQR